jgi:hypothetical protein
MKNLRYFPENGLAELFLQFRPKPVNIPVG